LPAVAGRFYPADPEELSREVARLLGGTEARPVRAHGVVAPHAGYVYSGALAGQVYRGVDVPERVVILAPNHTGRGARIAVAASGSFRMPGRDVPVDAELAAALLAEADGAVADWEAHRFEHAVEVHLPFLAARQPALRIVPVVLGGLGEAEVIAFGRALHRAASRAGGDVLVVASSDMSHYLPDAETREIDRVALEPLLALDPARLYRTVVDNDISMCGYLPATAMLAYARDAGATSAQLVGYATSGDAFGDRDRVVGYAGVVVPR
jgi:AmmeMemoRadiSam system protein B